MRIREIGRKLAIFIFALLITVTNIQIPVYAADTYKPEVLKTISGTGANVEQNGSTAYWIDGIGKIKVNGDIGFCIEPTVLGLGGTYSKHDDIPANIQTKLSRIVYYGWDTTNKTDQDYAVTQYMIWEALGANVTYWYGDFGNKYASLKAVVQKKIDNHTKTPKLPSGTQTVKVGETLTLTDSNNVLNDFKITNDGGSNATISNNKLIIKPDNDTPTTVTIKMQKVLDKYLGASIAYRSSADDGQDVGVFRVKDPIPVNVKINVEKFGTLKLTKQDEDGTMVPDTQFKISYNADMSNPIGTYKTGTDGTVSVDNLLPQTVYVQEVAVPSHLVLDMTVRTITVQANKTVTYTATNNWIKGKIQLKKTDAENGNQVAGATYAIYNDKGQELQRLVTTATGYVESGYLRFGNYTVKEVIAPEGFVLNEQIYNVTVNSNEQRIEVTGTDRPIKGYIQIVKKDTDSGKTVVAANTTFSVYKADDSYVTDITTNNNGIAKSDALRYGNYYLVEKTAPNNYTHSEQKIEYRISEDGKTYSAELSNKRTLGTINLTKEDSVTGNKPQGEATLSGAVYELKARDAILDPADNTVKYAKDTVVATLTTNDEAKASITDLYLGNYYIKEKSPSNGYTLDTTEYDIVLSYDNQNVSIVTKNQTVKERVIAQAFSIIKISSDETGESELLKGAEFTVKSQKDIDKYGSWEKAPLAKNGKGGNVATLVTDEKGYAVSEELPYGSYVIRETKTPDNKISVPDFTVVVDKDNREPQPWRIFNDKSFQSVIAFVKQDKDTLKTVALAGTKLKIKNLDTGEYVGYWKWNPLPEYVTSWTTDESGQVMTGDTLKPGNYQAEEITAPNGYILNTEPIKFEISSNVAYETLPDGITPVITITVRDKAVKGKISVEKRGEVLTDIKNDDNGNKQFIYTEQGIAGAVYEVIADEDILDPSNDGTVLYKKGVVVDTVTTPKNGIGQTKELPLGKYKISEVKAPEGFLLNGKSQTVTLEYADQNTPVVFENTSFKNERQKINILINKLDAESNTPLSGAIFGLYAKKDIMDINDKVLIKANDLIETAISDDDGKITFNADLPLTKFYTKEIKAPIGYVHSDTIINYDGTYQGQDTPIISFKNEFKNQITKVNISKQDITNNEEIEGAHLTVYEKENKQPFDTWISGQDGKTDDGKIKPHLIKGLEPGIVYILHEESSPYGFALAQDIEFKVQDKEDIQTVEMKDELVVGKLQWNKSGEIFNQVITGQTEFGKTVSPVWNESNLLSAEITIYAATDIKIGNQTYYQKDEVIQTLESDWDIVSSKNLPVGQYYYVESKVPHGYIIDTNKHYFEISDNQSNKEQIITSTLKNIRPKFDIDMTKTLEKQDIFENQEAYKDVLFGIYAREDIYDYKGRVAIENNSLIDTTGINEAGHLVNVPDLPNGVYYIKELATNSQYVLNEKEYDFEIAYHGEDVTKYVVQIGNDSKIDNELARGSIHVKKVDTLDKELKLENIDFNISANEDMSDIIKTVKTDNDGIATFDNLELGSYYIQEAKQIDGYTLNDHIYKVDVKANNDILEIVCENKPTEMNFSKIGETGTNELEGAKLQVINKETGAVIEEWVSGNTPHVINYLVEGKSYLMKEISSPKGYDKAETIEFIAGDGMKVVMKDNLTRISIEVNKIDSITKKNITTKNFEFTAYSDEECKNPIAVVKGDKTTGKAIFTDITYGTIYIKESKAPKGYKLSKEIKEVVIDENTPLVDGIYSFNYENELLPVHVIKTGDNTNLQLTLFTFILSGLGIVVYLSLRHKKREK